MWFSARRVTRAVVRLQDEPEVFIRVFEHEDDARRAFGLFAG
jgi:hypothetical protein